MTAPEPASPRRVSLWEYAAEVAGDIDVAYLVREKDKSLRLIVSHECGYDASIPVNRDAAYRLHHVLGRYLDGLPPEEALR